jgi:hypothetical protein
MNLYGRCVLTAVLLLAGYVVFVRGLGLLNRPSDWSLYAGIGVLFALVVLMPLAIRRVWGKR